MDGRRRPGAHRLLARARQGQRGPARRGRRAAVGDVAANRDRRHRHPGIRRRRRMAELVGPYASLAAEPHGNFQTMTTSEIATVLAWQDALAAADIETLAALSSDDIEMGDAQGAQQGHQTLRAWASSHPTSAELGRMYVHDG